VKFGVFLERRVGELFGSSEGAAAAAAATMGIRSCVERKEGKYSGRVVCMCLVVCEQVSHAEAVEKSEGVRRRTLLKDIQFSNVSGSDGSDGGGA